jgi:protein gp37
MIDMRQKASSTFTWDVVEGCIKLSQGCKHCFAERHLGASFHTPTLREDRINDPFRWETPRIVSVCDTSDLFQEAVPDWYIQKVLEVIMKCSSHTFIVLTKRVERMRGMLAGIELPQNMWVGVSAEDQITFDYRTPFLRNIKAKVRFVSLQPLLSAVDIGNAEHFEHIVVGGEYGPGARMFDDAWVSNIQAQSSALGVSMVYRQKQTNGGVEYSPKLNGNSIVEYPHIYRR